MAKQIIKASDKAFNAAVQSLSMDKAAKAKASQVRRGAMNDSMAYVGETLAFAKIEKDHLDGQAQVIVEATLRDMLKTYPTADYANLLRAPSKAEPDRGELRGHFVMAFENAYETAGREMPVKTLDNYLSRIRAFFAARGAEPLDLYSNNYARKADAKTPVTGGKKNGKVTTIKGDEEVGSPMDQAVTVKHTTSAQAVIPAGSKVFKVEGIAALVHFLQDWQGANQACTRQALLEKVHGLTKYAQDLIAGSDEIKGAVAMVPAVEADEDEDEDAALAASELARVEAARKANLKGKRK